MTAGGPSGVVLASASPQRRRILEDLGATFDVVVPEVEELETGDPAEVAVANAIAKAGAVSGAIVIGCDTVVATEAGLWGKPPTESDARRTLDHLSGRTHRVVSGLAVMREGRCLTATETTLVTFMAVPAAVRDRYLASGEWKGRAGGYAIQGGGAVLVERIEGCLLNVIGLPVGALLRLVPELR